MINVSEVVTVRVPFPNISSSLAVRSHMYICIKQGSTKEFLKCQTYKPTHEIAEFPPYKNVIEEADISRNPFQSKTTIDCDKSFIVENVTFDQRLLTTSRPDVCPELYGIITNETDHENFTQVSINPVDLQQLNSLIT